MVKTAALATLPLTAFDTFAAGNFPDRPIRLIVPFPAGQGADVAARLIAKEMEPSLGQPIVVDNRPGGNNVIGVKAVTGAPADGYSLFWHKLANGGQCRFLSQLRL